MVVKVIVRLRYQPPLFVFVLPSALTDDDAFRLDNVFLDYESLVETKSELYISAIPPASWRFNLSAPSVVRIHGLVHKFLQSAKLVNRTTNILLEILFVQKFDSLQLLIIPTSFDILLLLEGTVR